MIVLIYDCSKNIVFLKYIHVKSFVEICNLVLMLFLLYRYAIMKLNT